MSLTYSMILVIIIVSANILPISGILASIITYSSTFLIYYKWSSEIFTIAFERLFIMFYSSASGSLIFIAKL